MGIINPEIPSPGSPNSTEDQKITNGMGTIRDEINGGLDNDNIDAAANIVGSKLLDLSIATAKLADDAVTGAKIATDAVTADSIVAGGVGSAEIAALAVLSGKVKLYFDKSATGTTAATGVQASLASVPPGTYLVIGQLGTNGGVHTLQFAVGAGAATLTQPSALQTTGERIIGSGGSNYGWATHFGRAVVTSTATLQLTATVAAAGTVISNLCVFGIESA
jgi:hypothetical protein